MSKIKVFYGKEPWMHQFFIDFAKKRFYKYWDIRRERCFQKEVEIYNALSDTGLTPHLYSAYSTHDYHILELEFIPFSSIWGFGKEESQYEKLMQTPQQIKSIQRQFNTFCDILVSKGIIKEDIIDFEISPNNIIYNDEEDKAYFFDFAFAHHQESFQFLRRYIHSIFNDIPTSDTTSSFRIQSQQDIIDNFVFHNNNKDKALQLSRTIIQQISDAGPVYAYQSVYVGDALTIGQRDDSTIRFNDFHIHPEELQGQIVYDIGSSIGGNLPYYVDKGARKVVGIELSNISASIASNYLEYMRLMNTDYTKIEYRHCDATQTHYDDADVIFYLSCYRHFGSPDYHKRLGQHAHIIYIEGHAHAGEKQLIESFLHEFGDQWHWQFIGYTHESQQSKVMNRPIFKGVKHNG